MKLVPTLLLIVLIFAGTPSSAQDPNYVLELSSEVVLAGSDAVVRLGLTNTGGDIQGFSLGVCNDPGLVQPVAIELGPALQGMNGGSGPDFFNVSFFPEGLACGTVFSFTGDEVIPPGDDYEAANMTYETTAGLETTAELCFCGTLGSPPLALAVVVNGESIEPTTFCGGIELVGSLEFIRGDANADGSVNVADPIYVLSYLFTQGPGICLAAMDANSDDGLDVADALYLLEYINGSGMPPLAPFPGCGATTGMLTCVENGACP